MHFQMQGIGVGQTPSYIIAAGPIIRYRAATELIGDIAVENAVRKLDEYGINTNLNAIKDILQKIYTREAMH